MNDTLIPKRLRPGFTIIEAVVSILIVGILLASAMNLVGASRVGQTITGQRQRAHLLASELMEEIMAQPYEESGPLVLNGPEPGEQNGTRSNFDDVDDYDDWCGMPPQDRDGNGIAVVGNWSRCVKVKWVKPDNLDQLVGTESGVRLVTVEVKDGSRLLASIQSWRTVAR